MSLHADWKSAFSGAARQASAFMPIEIGLLGRFAPRVGLRRRKRRTFGRRRLSRRLKSASSGAGALGVGLRRRKRRTFGRRRLSRRLKSAFSGAYAPGVGLRRRKERFSGRRRPTVGRRPPEVEFIRRPRPSRRLKSASPGAARQASASADTRDALSVGAGRPLAEGPPRSNSFGAPCATRRPPPTQRGLSGRRRLSCRLKSAFSGTHAPGVGLRRRKERFSGRRRPTVGRRPLEAEFIRRTC
jgi:hypothetical protein